MGWTEIVVEAPAESVEAVTALLLEAGCQGVSETAVGVGSARRLTGFLADSDGLDAALDDLEDRLGRLPYFGLSAPTGFSVRAAVEADWANEWKKYFKPVEIGKRLVVKPSWEEYTGDQHRLVVEIDPGQAFGTGGHQTTRLCLAALEDYVRPGMIVADIGTGSGILAVAAARLGASVVHATDIDALPRSVARENAARNGLDGVIRVLELADFDREARDCDLVVANIIALTVVELTPSIASRLKPGGLFISSGIVEDRLPEVQQALADSGLRVVETRSDEIWRAVVAELQHRSQQTT